MTARPPALLEQFYAELGPMTGDAEYIRARSESLVRTFAAILDAPNLELIDSTPEGGKTDCSSKIWAPLQSPEGYLVTEHELSHWLFETDVVLASKFTDMVAGKLLRRAGLKQKPDDALAYEKHLTAIIHHLWNVLEDWRCCWLWTCLYYGGGTLLQRRWRDISEYEISPKTASENLVTFLMCHAAGVEHPGAPQAFLDCRKAMRRAMNLVEGVDAVACLAITSRLIDDIADALLDNTPPPQLVPQPQGGGGSGNGKPQTRGQSGTQQKREAQQQAQADAMHLLKLLLGAVPRTGPHALPQGKGSDGGVLGGEDLVKPDKERRGDGKLSAIQQLQGADDKESDDSGNTPFQTLMAQGADLMDARLEEARRAMVRNQDTPDEENVQVHLGWSRECGIPVVHVKPARELPPPTHVALENRRILEQMRMKKRRKRDHEGDFHTENFLTALGAGELDRPFHEKTVRTPRFELLFVFDLSGSMTIGQALPLTERALADSAHAVLAIRSKVYMWGFSDRLYMYETVGSMMHTSGVRHGSTCTVQALDVAHRWGKKSPTKRAIMLVTDGWPTSCRAKNSTGNPLDDMHAVLNEIRADKVPLTVLGIRHAMCTVADTAAQYDRAFGVGGYGMVGDFDDLARQLPKAVRIMAEAHITKGARRA